MKTYKNRVNILAFGCLVLVLLVCFASLFVGHSTKQAHAASYPGGMWVYPSNGFSFEPGVWYDLKAQAYPTNPGDPGIDHVNFTGNWGGQWHLICQVSNHDSNQVYMCPTDFRYANNGNYPPAGQMQLSFDVYARDGGVNYAPNGVHTGTYRAFNFGGVWDSPEDGFTVQEGSNLHLSAWAWPSNNGPALDSVHFTGYWSGSWHTICRAGPGADGDVHKYACDWNPSANGVQSGTFWVSFDVYDVMGNVKWGPNGIHGGTFHHSLALLAPFPYGTKFTIEAGYNDAYGLSCTVGTALDHCQNQLFGLDFVGSTTVLAPVGGDVTSTYKYLFNNVWVDCVFIQMDDALNLSVCHILDATLNAHQGDTIPRGKLLGQSDGHVHLNMDKRENLGYNYPNYYPVPFTVDHTIEGMSYTANHDGKGVNVSWLNATFVVDQQEYKDWTGQSNNSQL